MRARLRLSVLIAGFLLSACEGLGCSASPLGTLVSVEGTVERDFAAGPGRWEPAEVGARFEEGDGLRTGADATAMVDVGAAGKVKLESETLIRFFSSAQRGDGQGAAESGPGIDVQQGAAAIETGEAPVTIQTAMGSAVIARKSRIRMTRGSEGVRYRVMFGGAAFDQRDGARKELSAGDEIEVGIGLAVLHEPGDDRAKEIEPAASAEATAQDAVRAQIRGSVRQRIGDGEWAELPDGARSIRADTELDVAEGSTVEVDRDGQRATLVGAGHYRIGARGAPLVRAIDGRLTVHADTTDVVIRVPGGRIVAKGVEGGTLAEVAVRAADLSSQVTAVSGQVEALGDERVELGAGDTITMRDELGAADDEESAAEDDEGDDDGDGDDAATAELRGSARRVARAPELTVDAGESFRIYDPKPPTLVAFRVPAECAQGAELRLRGVTTARGKDRITMSLKRGLHSYDMHCLKGERIRRRPAASGRVRVVRSRGTSQPPTTAPKNSLDINGRRYTLMYQNLKPILTVRWPGAPRASGYRVYVTSPKGGTRKYAAKKPSRTLPPRALREGKNRIRFATTGKKAWRSEESVVDVVFDNAAPAASLSLPPPRGFAPGSSTPIAGIAVSGSRVSVGGRAIPLDDKSRFEVDLPIDADTQALAIRFQHPRHGVRYYLRRAIGSR